MSKVLFVHTEILETFQKVSRFLGFCFTCTQNLCDLWTSEHFQFWQFQKFLDLKLEILKWLWWGISQRVSLIPQSCLWSIVSEVRPPKIFPKFNAKALFSESLGVPGWIRPKKPSNFKLCWAPEQNHASVPELDASFAALLSDSDDQTIRQTHGRQILLLLPGIWIKVHTHKKCNQTIHKTPKLRLSLFWVFFPQKLPFILKAISDIWVDFLTTDWHTWQTQSVFHGQEKVFTQLDSLSVFGEMQKDMNCFWNLRFAIPLIWFENEFCWVFSLVRSFSLKIFSKPVSSNWSSSSPEFSAASSSSWVKTESSRSSTSNSETSEKLDSSFWNLNLSHNPLNLTGSRFPSPFAFNFRFLCFC